MELLQSGFSGVVESGRENSTQVCADTRARTAPREAGSKGQSLRWQRLVSLETTEEASGPR